MILTANLFITKKIKNEVTIRSSAAEYLTYIAATGDDKSSIEMIEEAISWKISFLLFLYTIIEVPQRQVARPFLKSFR